MKQYGFSNDKTILVSGFNPDFSVLRVRMIRAMGVCGGHFLDSISSRFLQLEGIVTSFSIQSRTDIALIPSHIPRSPPMLLRKVAKDI